MPPGGAPQSAVVATYVQRIILTNSGFFFSIGSTISAITGSHSHYFLFADAQADIIDPTILVRRSWFINLISKALEQGHKISVNSDHAITVPWPEPGEPAARLATAITVYR
jgi:hypothetical protein